MNIGLIPMSAKPYHLGHHMLVEFAALGVLGDEIVHEEAPDNDLVVVFVSYSSRGVKSATVKKVRREVPVEGETPVFGDDMRHVWQELLIPNLDLPSNVLIKTPDDGIPNSPIRCTFDVLDALKQALDAGERSAQLPYIGETVDPRDTVISLYSDDEDIERNYPNEYMENRYPGMLGKSILKVGVPRSSTVQISGTKMRNLLCTGEREAFVGMLPPLPAHIGNEIYDVLSTSIVQSCPRSQWSKVGEGLIRQFVREVL